MVGKMGVKGGDVEGSYATGCDGYVGDAWTWTIKYATERRAVSVTLRRRATGVAKITDKPKTTGVVFMNVKQQMAEKN